MGLFIVSPGEKYQTLLVLEPICFLLKVQFEGVYGIRFFFTPVLFKPVPTELNQGILGDFLWGTSQSACCSP